MALVNSDHKSDSTSKQVWFKTRPPQMVKPFIVSEAYPDASK